MLILTRFDVGVIRKGSEKVDVAEQEDLLVRPYRRLSGC